MILGISHDLGGMGVCDELTVVVVDVLLAGDQLAAVDHLPAAAEDGHLLRVFRWSWPTSHLSGTGE